MAWWIFQNLVDDGGAGRDGGDRLPVRPHRTGRPARAVGARAREVHHAAARGLAVGGARSTAESLDSTRRSRRPARSAAAECGRRASPDQIAPSIRDASTRIRRRRPPIRVDRTDAAVSSSPAWPWLVALWIAGSRVSARRSKASRLVRQARRVRTPPRFRRDRGDRATRVAALASQLWCVARVPSSDDRRPRRRPGRVVPGPAETAVAGRRCPAGCTTRRLHRRVDRARARAHQTPRSHRRLDRARRRRGVVVESACSGPSAGAARAGRARVRCVGHFGVAERPACVRGITSRVVLTWCGTCGVDRRGRRCSRQQSSCARKETRHDHERPCTTSLALGRVHHACRGGDGHASGVGKCE